MAYIKLKSDNPGFSRVLQKNPATQEAAKAPFEKNTKTARTYLWFENPQEVFLLLKNFDNKRGKGFEYLDYDSFSGGQVHLQLLNTQLRTALTVVQELDTYPAELEFNIYNSLEKDFTKSFPGKVVECITQNRHSKVTIKGDTVKQTLEICSLISLFSFLHNQDVYVEEDQFVRYLNVAVSQTTHYPFIRNFVSFIKSPAVFKQLQPVLDTTPFNFSMKKAYEARKEFYLKYVPTTTNTELLDLGCGEGGYFKLHMKGYEKVNAVEVDNDVYTDATHSVRKIQAEDKITVHHSSIEDYLDGLTTLKGVDVLITEVLEHMPHANALEVVERLVKLEPDQIILTLPNHSFNKFYDLAEGEFRHDDHDWEPDYAMVKYLLDTIWPLDNYDYTVEFLGDSLKTDSTVCTTFGIHLKRKD